MLGIDLPARNSLAALGAMLVGVALIAEPTDALFTATTTSPGSQTATATLALSNDRSAAGDLITLADVVPGDSAIRTVTITNDGDVAFTYVASVSSDTEPATTLWTDTTDGLQVIVRRTDASGTVLYPSGDSSPGPLKDLDLAASGTIAAGASETLWMEFSLPATAGNTFQGLTQSFTITYTATQLAGVGALTIALLRAISTAALGAALLALCGVLALRAAGWSTLVLSGGSMAPALPIGALALVRPIHPSELRIGDIVTVRTGSGLLTHRVVGISAGPEGHELALKGDANPVADVQRVVLADRAGLVVAALPEAGRVVAYARAYLRAAAGSAGLALLLVAALAGLRPRRPSRTERLAALREAVLLAPADLAPHRQLAAMLLNNGDVDAALAEHARFEAALIAAGDVARAQAEREYRDAMLSRSLGPVSGRPRVPIAA